ncbi:hypothetical protein Tco_1245213 [Tanacetum coccineum]
MASSINVFSSSTGYSPFNLDPWTVCDAMLGKWCACCKVFGHVQEEYPKNIGAGETKNLRKTSQTPKGISVSQKPTNEVSKSNHFEVLTSVEKDVELGTNGRTSNLASQETNSSGSSFWNVDPSSPSTTPIIDKIDNIENLIIDGKVTLVDDEGKPWFAWSGGRNLTSYEEIRIRHIR